MRLELTGRHLAITPAMRALVGERIDHTLKLLNDSAVSAHVVLTRERARIRAEVTLHARRERFLHSEATGQNVELAYVDQGYTGEKASESAAEHGIRLEVVKHEEAKRGFVLLPRRWVVERDFAWASRFRRLVKDYERLPDTVAGLHFVAFACLFLQQAAGILSAGS